LAAKLILDTDIGTDVDDAWALSLCLASKNIDLVGVTLVHADLETRAKIALKLLNLARRLKVPVYKGVSKPLTEGARLYWGGHEGTETDFSDIACLSARDGGVEFILESARKHRGELVVCPIGPMTNVGEAIRRDPETMRKVKRIVIMGGTFKGEGLEAASPEHNACVDPAATKLVLESGIPTTLVGLNVTMQVTIRREDVAPLEGWAYGDYLAAMSYQYFNVARRDVLYMHDPLAVATVIDPSLVETRPMSAQVLDDGRIVWTSGGPIDVCTGVDVPGFTKLLLDSAYSIRKQGETQCR
jgi:purine nucleosidase